MNINSNQIELTEEQLEYISGGSESNNTTEQSRNSSSTVNTNQERDDVNFSEASRVWSEKVRSLLK